MLRMASDADYNDDILRGLFQQQPDLNLVRARDVGLRTTVDPILLEWAASNGRILLTHDRTAMSNFAYERVRAGQPMPGLLVIRNKPPFGPLIEDILLVALCSEPHEWKDRVEFLPRGSTSG